MRWVNIQGEWFDFEKVKHFSFVRYGKKNKDKDIVVGRVYFHFIGDARFSSGIYFDFHSEKEEKEVREFLEDIIARNHSFHKFVKKKEEVKETAPEKEKKEERMGFLSEKCL